MNMIIIVHYLINFNTLLGLLTERNDVEKVYKKKHNYLHLKNKIYQIITESM